MSGEKYLYSMPFSGFHADVVGIVVLWNHIPACVMLVPSLTLTLCKCMEVSGVSRSFHTGFNEITVRDVGSICGVHVFDTPSFQQFD